jgi:group I intron endonuclease
MPVIYKATNKVNGKIYIGYDSAWPNRRYQHIWESSRRPTGVVFHQAIKKYGADQFEWSIEYESSDPDFTLNIMEGYFIRLYQSHYSTGKGYNMSYGGEGQIGFRHSPDTIAKFKRRIPWNKGVKTGAQTQEHIEKVRKSISGKKDKHWELVTPSGNVIQIKNLNGFCKLHGLNVGHMWSVARGLRKSHKGWKCPVLKEASSKLV